jgi:LuxR family maltose regulon positive regulatory protein
LDNKIILVSAPAGYGKTTLLCTWLSQCPYTATWISLDEGDSDLARFLTYLIAALRKIHTEIGKTVIALLQSPQVLPTEVILTTLINELAQIQDQFILVLDDYHLIQEEKVHQAVNFLLEKLPWQVHLVISTRADPSLPLARLRARSQMLELRATDLCFTPDETEEFLNRTMGLTISNDDVGKITVRTEGWIAGLQMAAVSMQESKDTSRFIQNFAGSNRHVLD